MTFPLGRHCTFHVGGRRQVPMGRHRDSPPPGPARAFPLGRHRTSHVGGRSPWAGTGPFPGAGIGPATWAPRAHDLTSPYHAYPTITLGDDAHTTQQHQYEISIVPSLNKSAPDTEVPEPQLTSIEETPGLVAH